MGMPQRPRVLIAEGDSATRRRFSEMLLDDSRLVTVESSEAALETVDPNVDVALLDGRTMDGSIEGFVRRLRATGFDGPVVMTTDREPDGDVRRLGVDEYLLKPVEESELRDLVETLLLQERYDAVLREYISFVSLVTDRYLRESGEFAVDGDPTDDAVRLKAIKEQAYVALETAIETGKVDELYPDIAIEASSSGPNYEAGVTDAGD